MIGTRDKTKTEGFGGGDRRPDGRGVGNGKANTTFWPDPDDKAV